METPITRREIITLLSAAMVAESYKFVYEAAQSWVKVYPADLEVNFYLGKSLVGLKRDRDAIDIIKQITEKDPEYLSAHTELAGLYQGTDEDRYMSHLAYIHALDGSTENINIDALPVWSRILSDIRLALINDNLDIANSLVTQIQNVNPPIDLIGVTQIQIAKNENDVQSIKQLAEIYMEQFPSCIHFPLWLANCQMETSGEGKYEPVSLLHKCVSQDAGGQVVKRIWGDEHRYKALWPEIMQINFEIAIPADVMAVMGLNQLPQGTLKKTYSTKETGNQKPTNISKNFHSDNQNQTGIHKARTERVKEQVNSVNKFINHDGYRPADMNQNQDNEFIYEEITQHVQQKKEKNRNLESVEKVFENIANRMKKPDIAKLDARYPVYVIFSSRKALENIYGPNNVGVIDTALKQLESTIRKQNNGWDALVFYPDDEKSADQSGLPPIVSSDPWKLKLSLTDLDNALSNKGKMVASVLIIGGPEIVPFHKLPNPTEDMDAEVLSDSPYATHDSNYFVPEWPVGRIPGEAGSDPSFLIKQIRNIIDYHTNWQREDSIWSRFPYPVDEILQWFWNISRFSSLRIKLGKNITDGFGYTAAIWRRSSIAVYRPVSEAGAITISPPTDASSLNVNKVLNSNKGYFNLHGIENSGEWFGQKDTNDSSSSIDYPIAIKPDDIYKNGHCPQLVYSEACYGAHINGKNIKDALSLKFKSIGTDVFIGSTCIAYGSVTTPLIGADLLGYVFWKLVNEGYTIGDAFTKAKIEFAREMTKRQGYLDGEDQKTLISFIMLGDPLATANAPQTKTKQRISRSKQREKIKTICDNEMSVQVSQKISREVLRDVKKNLEKYLPGLDDAKVSLSHQFVGYQEYQQDSQGVYKREKNIKLEKTGNVVVTVSKNINYLEKQHHHYARVTLDDQGKMVKLAISR